MLVPICNCDRQFTFLPSKTLLKPCFPIPIHHYPNLRFKTLRRLATVSSAAENQTLPQSAIQRIADKLRSLGYVEEQSSSNATTKDENETVSNYGPNSPGEIFVPLRNRLPKYRVGHTLDPSWSTPENPVPEPGSGNAVQRFHELRRGVLEEEERERVRKRNEGGALSLAELKLSKEELRRLRSEGIGLRKKLKVGKAGITEGIVNGIHERWRRSELVKIVCEDICRLNMKRTHDLLEKKTGGLVVWRSGSNIILYRGPDYKYPYFLTDDKLADGYSSEESPDAEESPALNSSTHISHAPVVQGVGLPNRVRFQLPGEAQLAEEANTLLEGLGPRFSDWWGYDPLPVDADLLPAVVPGYKRPFRLLPYGVKPKLTNDEMTTLRRLARPLPSHFVLGRNRKHQGLAAAIVKLWEKCEIAKIAVKRGVQNTNSELMAEELKWLTGGTLLSRDKEFIVFYRGKDFLPAAVSSAIEERRKCEMDVLKNRKSNALIFNAEEHKDVNKESAAEVEHEKENDKLQFHSDRKLKFSEAVMDRTQTKLSMALAKKTRAEKLLEDLEKEEIPQPPEIDKEGITEEERYMLRKVGLRMKAFLLLGRRGVFDGTVENMHLHWKYRELVKVCIGRRSIEEVHGIARTLEAESGGILVAVERVSRGYAIIVYRGKNYKRPASLRPQTLLSKREAMKRSIEAQRRESLKLHVLKLSKNIDELKLRLSKDKDAKDIQLTEDVKLESVEDEIYENLYNEDEVPFKDSVSGYQSYLGCPEKKELKFREGHESDATKDPEDHIHTSKNSVHIVQQDAQGDVSLHSASKGNYLFEKTEAELQPRALRDENINVESGNVERSDCLESQDRTSASTTSHNRRYARGSDSSAAYRKAELKPDLQKKKDEKSSVMPFRASQLSNRERLLLRKQALRMKNPPVLAVGKSNIVGGVAKAIKEHFKKHPLAIVSIKGRAKGTSVREVIYNLEQATGAVLVSQEPSKVILYRGWGSGAEPDQASGEVNKNVKSGSVGGEVKDQLLISPELISAIRLECGLEAANEDAALRATIDDGREN